MSCIARYIIFNADGQPNWQESISRAEEECSEKSARLNFQFRIAPLKYTFKPVGGVLEATGMLYMHRQHGAIQFNFYTFDPQIQQIVRHNFHLFDEQLDKNVLPQICKILREDPAILNPSGKLLFNLDEDWGFHWQQKKCNEDEDDDEDVNDWSCHGPMVVYIIHNLQKISFPYDQVDREVKNCDFRWKVPCDVWCLRYILKYLAELMRGTVLP